MKRFHVHPNELNVFENNSSYIYAGTNNNNVKVYFSNKTEDLLSPMELSVFKNKHLSIDEISKKFNISLKTVNNYFKRIDQKLC